MSSIIEKAMLTMLAALGLFLAAVIAIMVDEGLATEHEATGAVVSKRFEPSHITTTYMMVGKVMVPNTICHDAAWYVGIQAGDTVYTREISENMYGRIEYGEKYDFFILKGLFGEY